MRLRIFSLPGRGTLLLTGALLEINHGFTEGRDPVLEIALRFG